MTDELTLRSSARQDLAAKIAVLLVAATLLAIFAIALATGYFATIDILRGVVLAGTLGLGSSLAVAAIYGGLLLQELRLDASGITYRHGSERTIAWSDLSAVRVLGVTSPHATSYALQFRSKSRDIVVGSDFGKKDLLEAVRLVKRRQPSFTFEIIEQE